MLNTNVVIFTALAYVIFLFGLAFFSERRASRHRSDKSSGLLQSPWVYTLSISVYCTSWTFYGAVGSAARNGLEFATIYIGPTLVFIGGWFFLRKLIRIGSEHRITSIADFISSRYGKNTTVAVLVTVIAVIVTTPYIALQLKAVASSFAVVSRSTSGALGGVNDDIVNSTAMWVAIAMALFTILFGTRRLDADEHHPGVVAAIAFEAIIKLLALLAVGFYVVFAIAGGVPEVFALPATQELMTTQQSFGARWITLILLAAMAVVCLPRQFQVTVVENTNEKHLRTAVWLFPLYLFLISLFVLPIAIVGLSTLPEGADPDMFLLTLPLFKDQEALALFAFIGGFSSATSMVIIASIAVSTMVSNHIVVPLALKLPSISMTRSGDLKSLLLRSRRASIVIILMLGYLYFRLSGQSDALAAIGLIAFAGVAQFVPALVGGVYWRNATASGAIWGLSAGVVIWLFTLFVPGFATPGSGLQTMVEQGLFGWSALRPYALFGMVGVDPLVHALFWSLLVNTVLFVIVSIVSTQQPMEKLQSALFVDVFRNLAGAESRIIDRSAASADLYTLAQRILGADEAYVLFKEFAERQGVDDDMPRPDADFIAHLERRLAGSIGAASANVLVSQVAIGETISLDEVIKLVDETQQVIEYSQQLESQSDELQTTAARLREANEQLRELDVQKDNFLSQVSHEVRTPMTSIRSFAEILLESDDVDSQESRKFINIIHQESLRLTRLLDEILEPGVLDRGELDFELATVNLNETLRHAVETCRGMAEKQNVTIHFSSAVSSDVEGTEADEPLHVQADADRLTQVFINVINNAVKYNTSDNPVVAISTLSRAGQLHVMIADNGPGIPDDERARIFDKYYRLNPGSAGEIEGAGLGLAISRQIMRKLGGDLILVDQAPGVAGACFSVSLPVVKSSSS